MSQEKTKKFKTLKKIEEFVLYFDFKCYRCNQPLEPGCLDVQELNEQEIELNSFGFQLPGFGQLVNINFYCDFCEGYAGSFNVFDKPFWRSVDPSKRQKSEYKIIMEKIA